MGIRSRRKAINGHANAPAEEEIDAPPPLLRLPSHLLDSVLARLDLRSHLRLGVTCSFLHHHATILNPPLSKCPSFIPRFNLDSRIFYGYLHPFHIFDSDPRVPISRRVKCVGSSHGWLAIVRVVREHDDPSFHGDVHIFHRLSRRQMTLPRFHDWSSVEKVVFNLDSRGDICFVAVVYDGSWVAVCAPLRGLPWRMVFEAEDEQGFMFDVSDLAFHKTLLWVLSFADDRRTVVVASCFSFPVEFGDEPLLTVGVTNSAAGRPTFLVNLSEKLLAVVPEVESRDGDIPRGFRAWECEETRLIERTHLDGRALLLRVGFKGELDTDLVEFDMEMPQGVAADEMGLMDGDCLYFLSDADAYIGFKYVYDPEKGKFVSEENAMPLSKR